MRTISFLLVGFIVFFSVAIFIMHNAFGSASSPLDVHEQHAILMQLISRHNDSINDFLFQQSFRSKSGDEIINVVASKDNEITRLSTEVSTVHQLISEKDNEIARLRSLLAETAQRPASVSAPSAAPAVPAPLPIPMTAMEQSCDDRYGDGLVRKWRASRQVWCDTPASEDDTTGSIVCYPYHQEHKKLDGRGPDIFCEAKNLFFDFSKVPAM